MRFTRALGLVGFGLATLSVPATAQRWDDSFTWSIGAQAGILGFETPTQTRTWVPTFGANLVVIAAAIATIVQALTPRMSPLDSR